MLSENPFVMQITRAMNDLIIRTAKRDRTSRSQLLRDIVYKEMDKCPGCGRSLANGDLTESLQDVKTRLHFREDNNSIGKAARRVASLLNLSMADYVRYKLAREMNTCGVCMRRYPERE